MQLSPGTLVFVTGGSGFVGRALIRELRRRGCHVRALARSETAASTVRMLDAVPVTGDLVSQDSMRAGMEGAALVIHAAAKVDLWGPRREAYLVTVQGTRNALKAAEAAGVPRFVHISTEAVLAGGFPIIQADETTPYPSQPNGVYPWSKGHAERAVIGRNGPNMATIVVRPRFIWGAGDTTLMPALTKAMQSGAWAWFDGGHHFMSTCHISNVVEGTLLAAEQGHAGEIYFLTDGQPVEFRDFLTRLAATQGITAPAREAPLWLAKCVASCGEFVWRRFSRPGAPPITKTMINLLFQEVTVVDRKAREELGYRGSVSIDQGLDELRGTPVMTS
jgi:nucleoside-diphosphate-sugar epimerase